MGLDWNPLARPRAGFEAEFDRLATIDLDSLSEQDQHKHIARFKEITEAPYEVLGAPRVGSDAEADAWLLARLRENNAVDQFDDARQQMAGYYVLDLLPRSPGFGACQAG